MERNVKLETGKVYHNKGGGDFYVPPQVYTPNKYLVRNIRSGWTCVAHNITLYDDGSIEWDYSTGGVFR